MCVCVCVCVSPGRALTYILENSFKAESGSRPDVPKIGILITDGKSQDDVLSPAQRLRDAGIELFAIGTRTKPALTQIQFVSKCCFLTV